MKNKLIEDLTVALERMVDVTCASMRALWLGATVRERRDLLGAERNHAPIAVPPGFAKWKKARRSKYEALAMFRHAVVWRAAPTAWSSESVAGRVYFTPCPDAVPFFHAQQVDGHSAAGKVQLDRVRTELAVLIRAVRDRRAHDPSWTNNELLVADSLVERSTRRTLRDTFKMEGSAFDTLFDDSPDRGA